MKKESIYFLTFIILGVSLIRLLVGVVINNTKSLQGNNALIKSSTISESVGSGVKNTTMRQFEISYYWGIYADEITNSDAIKIAQAGFTVVPLMPSNSIFWNTSSSDNAMSNAINILNNNNIKVIVFDYHISNAISLYSSSNDSLAINTLKNTVDFYSQFPNVVGFDLGDEPFYDSAIPSTKDLNSMKKVANKLYELDPTRQCYLNLFPEPYSDYYSSVFESYYGISSYESYLNDAIDNSKMRYLSIDHYPQYLRTRGVGTDVDLYYHNLGLLTNSYTSHKKLSYKNIIINNCIDVTPNYDYQISEQDIWFQTNANLAFGGNRVTYFTYAPMQEEYMGIRDGMIDSNKNTTDIYNYVKNINKWLKNVGNELFNKDVIAVYLYNNNSETGSGPAKRYIEYDDKTGIVGRIQAKEYIGDNTAGNTTEKASNALVTVFDDDIIMLVNTDSYLEENIETANAYFNTSSTNRSRGIYSFPDLNLLQFQYFDGINNNWINLTRDVNRLSDLGFYISCNANYILLDKGKSIQIRKQRNLYSSKYHINYNTKKITIYDSVIETILSNVSSNYTVYIEKNSELLTSGVLYTTGYNLCIKNGNTVIDRYEIEGVFSNKYDINSLYIYTGFSNYDSNNTSSNVETKIGNNVLNIVSGDGVYYNNIPIIQVSLSNDCELEGNGIKCNKDTFSASDVSITNGFAIYNENQSELSIYSNLGDYIETKTVLFNPENSDFHYEGFFGPYDSLEHSITVLWDGASIEYSTDGVVYQNQNPTFRDVGDHLVYFKAVKGNQSYRGSAYVQIYKAQCELELSTDYGFAFYPDAITVDVTKNTSNGTISVRGGNNFDINIENNNKIKFKLKEGISTDIYEGSVVIQSAETSNCYGASKLFYFTMLRDAAISHNGYTGTYDGEEHGINVSCLEISDGLEMLNPKIMYGLQSGTYNLENTPKYRNVGDYEVFYQITKKGVSIYEASEHIVITKADEEIVLSNIIGDVFVGGTTSFTIDSMLGDGTLSVSSDDNTVATATISGKKVTVNGMAQGTTIIRVKSNGSENYKDAETTYRINVMTKSVTGIAMQSNPSKTEYIQNSESLNLSGATIKVTYNDNTTETKDITTSMVSGFDNSTVGEKTITVTYGGKTTSFTVNIVAQSTPTPSAMPTPTSTGYEGEYDGYEHGITVVSTEPGAKIMYGIEENNYTLEDSPKYKDAGTYTIYFEVSKEGFISYKGSETVRIMPARASIVISRDEETSVMSDSVRMGKTIEFDIDKTGDGNLTVSSSDDAVATASINGTKLTVNGLSVGSARITVKSSSTRNYEEATKSIDIAVLDLLRLPVNHESKITVYDGEEYGIIVTCDVEGATIKYGLEEGNYILNECPKYRDVGTYTIYFEVSKDEYLTVTGSEEVIITKANGSISVEKEIVEIEELMTNENTIIENKSGGEITVESSDENIVEARLEENRIVLNAKQTEGSATITVKSGETNNYFEAETTFEVRVVKPQLDSIEIVNLPEKLNYIQNYENLDVSEGTIKLNYSNGTSEIINITEDMVSGFDNSELGTLSLTVTYEDKTATYDVEIVPKQVVSVKVMQQPLKIKYSQRFEELSVEDGLLEVTYNDNTVEVVKITPDMVAEIHDNGSSGAIIVEYEGCKTSYYVIKNEFVAITIQGVTKIEFEKTPSKREYIKGEDLDVSGGKLKVYYSDGRSETIDVAQNMVRGFNSNRVGSQTLTVRYRAKSVKYSILIKNDIKPTPTPTPTPEEEIIVTPTPIPTQEVEVTPTPVEENIVTPTPTQEVIITPTPKTTVVTPTPTQEPIIVPSPVPTQEVVVTPTPEKENIVTPTPTQEVIITPSPVDDKRYSAIQVPTQDIEGYIAEKSNINVNTVGATNTVNNGLYIRQTEQTGQISNNTISNSNRIQNNTNITNNGNMVNNTNSISNKPLPKTGSNIVRTLLISSLLISSIVFFVKYYKYKDID